MDFGEHASPTGGVQRQAHYLEGHFAKRNARLNPDAEFNATDRHWRREWLKDQHLSANDGKLNIYANADYRKARYNILRRAFRAPMDFVELNVLSKMMTWQQARGARVAISIFGGFLAAGAYLSYYTLYCSNDWTRWTGIKSIHRRVPVFEGSSEYPECQSQMRTQKSDYCNLDFKPETDGKIKSSTPLRYA